MPAAIDTSPIPNRQAHGESRRLFRSGVPGAHAGSRLVHFADARQSALRRERMRFRGRRTDIYVAQAFGSARSGALGPDSG